MSRVGTVCRHPERKGIDRLLLRLPYRSVAQQFGLSESATYRHHKDHLPLRLLSAAAEEEQVSAPQVLSDLRGLQVIGATILRRAMQGGDLALALRAIAELRGLLATTLRAVETSELEQRLTALETNIQEQQRRLA